MDWYPLYNSLRIAAIACVAVFFTGIFAAYYVAKLPRLVKGLLDVVLTLPMVLPPTVVGYFLLLLFGVKRPFGIFLARFGIKVPMTWWSAVFAAAVVSFPLMYRTARGAFEAFDEDLADAGRTLGLSNTYIFWRVRMPVCRQGILAGTVLTFARALGEYGATSMIAGYTPGRTATISTTVYQLWRTDNEALACRWVRVNLAISVVDIEKDYGGFHLCSRFETNGGITGLLGASGCGKSQTLRCIAGVQTPDQGRIVLDGVTLYDSERHINLTPQQRGVGYLFQSYALFPNMTVRANILTGLRREKDAAKKQAAFEHAIHLLKLERLEDRRPAQLSGGQAQRVALARMLVSRPKALLLDEPFSAIDSHLRDQLQVDLLALLADFPGDMVIVTHSRDEAYHMCGQIAVMDAGRVLAHGPTKQVFADPRTVQGGRLTGCKNIFPARKVDDHTIFVPDWGVDLHPARMVEDGLVAMGVRAHSFRPEEVRNPLAVHCVGKMEEPFERLIRMRAEGQTAGSPDLWWRVSKEIVPETMPTRLGVAPEQVLLFYE